MNRYGAKNKKSLKYIQKIGYHGQVDQRDRPHGLGRLIKFGHLHEGIFWHGKKIGFGRSIFTDGSYYQGFFKDGYFHGNEGKLVKFSSK